MIFDDSFDLSKFIASETLTTFKSNGFQPKLGFSIISFYMHVDGLVAITCIEEETKWSKS